MIDGKFKNYPNLNRMLATCRMNPRRCEYIIYYLSFIELFHAFGITGGMEDEIWERLGFPVNRNIHSEDVTISQEHLQRRECLTLPYQRVLRGEQLQAIHKEIREKTKEIIKKSDEKLKAKMIV